MMRWYCVHIDQRLDLLALLMLTKQGFTTFLPNFRPTRTAILQAVFPGYLFVQFDVVRDRWRPICSTPGVRRLFSATPEQPIAMPDPAMADLMQRYGPGGSEVEAIAEGKLAPVPEGTRITMKAGPFAGFVGICTWSDADRIKLLFEIFGHASTLNVARSSAMLSD